jgi:aminoglycoside 3-N-acetyltransferase I
VDYLEIKRLTPGDRREARDAFAMMTEVFGEPDEGLPDDYVDRLLADDSFWAYAAYAGSVIVGAITAHTLPMTRSASSELFIYDLAVRTDHQRQGVGTQLVQQLRRAAARAGIADVFVPADDEDVHALDFYRALGASASPVTIFTFTAP